MLLCVSGVNSKQAIKSPFLAFTASSSSLSQSNNKLKQRTRDCSTTKSNQLKLHSPQIIFSNNHLLIVNKPPGWKSQPGDHHPISDVDPKCLLTYLQTNKLGGGSQRNFISPTHRLDQPCSGVLIFAKNSKAASRVQSSWSKGMVDKEYWVVVEGSGSGIVTSSNKKKNQRWNGLELLHSRSCKINSNDYRFSAVVASKKGNNGSVIVKPIPPNSSKENTNQRICHIEWKHLLHLSDSKHGTRHLLSVKTNTGAKHQVRALLASGGAPIAGDLRYGNNILQINQGGGRVYEPLHDRSVALHARSVFMPNVSLGGMEFLKKDPFVAEIPCSWKELFGIGENDVGHF
eukprot:scaffold55881_cov77-Cyclotella_meneghiniana.AAC.4